MNMHTSIKAASSHAAISQSLLCDKWDVALADYEAKPTACNAMPIGTEGEDEAVDAYCQAMDFLIESVPAETVEQLKVKIDLALERASAFEGIFDDHKAGIVSDLERMCGPMAGFAFSWLQRWTFLGGSVTFAHDNPDKTWIGQPAYDLSPVAADNETLIKHVDLSRLSETDQRSIIEQRRARDQAFYEGGMREIYDLLTAVPGSVPALKAVLRINPKLGFARQKGD